MDRYGSQPVAQTVGLYCMLLPLTYLFLGPRSFWLLPLANLFNGMTMPVCDLAQQNIYLAKAPARNRTMYVAVFFTSTQLLGTALSNFAGGLLMQGPFQTLEQMQFAFCGCAVNRYDYLFFAFRAVALRVRVGAVSAAAGAMGDACTADVPRFCTAGAPERMLPLLGLAGCTSAPPLPLAKFTEK